MLKMSNNKHNMHTSKVYKTWCSMIARCNPDNKKDAKYYSERGITVCDEWRTFANFYADMGERPEGMTIERIDNNKGYSPENCKWSTRKEQNRNMRSNRMIQFNGISMCITDWAKKLGITPQGLGARLGKHPIEIALMEKIPKAEKKSTNRRCLP